MGKLYWRMVLLFVSFTLVAACAFAADNMLKITDMGGKVQVKVSPSEEWTDAMLGQALNKKDAVKTGPDGRLVLEFPDKSSLTLNPKTEIAVEELVWDNAAKKVGINMSSGQLKTLLKTPSEFKVKTPTAICGARGTVFYIFIEGTDTKVFVDEGSVDFTSTVSGDSYVVVQGMQSVATVTGTLSEPKELTGEEKVKVLAEWQAAVAEQYAEPAGKKDKADNMPQQQGTPENPAQENEASQI